MATPARQSIAFFSNPVSHIKPCFAFGRRPCLDPAFRWWPFLVLSRSEAKLMSSRCSCRFGFFQNAGTVISCLPTCIPEGGEAKYPPVTTEECEFYVLASI